MVNQEVLQGSWTEIKGKLRSKWGQLSDDDLQHIHGNVEQLVGLIQRKTGETRAAIEEFLDEAASEGSSMMEQVSDEVSRRAHDAADMVREQAHRAADTVEQGYEDAEELVRRRPVESVAIGFGAGVLIGVLMGLIVQRR